MFSAILRGTVIPLIPSRGPSCRIKFKRLAVYKTSSLRKAFASREVHKATENLPIKKAKNIRPNGDFTAMNPVVQWSNNVKKQIQRSLPPKIPFDMDLPQFSMIELLVMLPAL